MKLQDYKKASTNADILFAVLAIILVLGLAFGAYREGRIKGKLEATLECSKEISRVSAELKIVRYNLDGVTSQEVFKKP
jgi:hypothetical protein